MQAFADIEEFSETDVHTLLAALADRSRRVQRVVLSKRTIWIKQYGTEQASIWMKLQGVFAAALPVEVLKPSRQLDPAGMVSREVRKIEAFRAKGFPTPTIVYRSPTSLILTDVGRTVDASLLDLRAASAEKHDELLVTLASELGRLHAAGLCHGRPHPRDFALNGDQITFLDFEEEPDAVMSLPCAQARDMWLLLLQIASRMMLGMDSLNAAYSAWAAKAPAEADRELKRITRFLTPLVPIARALNQLRHAKDVHRFIVLMAYLSQFQ
ncbi:tRNA A-37 threonylcarbamoyl transferase component Bud32 [Ensifer sp. KUDG1]|uniref:serine/threonine protein phosphatase n=1 Tax=Ensifer sp. KUDG1 TaxID=3373919 RepID=UPI003D1FDEAB